MTATRGNLRSEADRWIGDWIEAHGGGDEALPPGNTAAGSGQWTLAPEEWSEDSGFVAPAQQQFRSLVAGAAGAAGRAGAGSGVGRGAGAGAEADAEAG